MNLLRMLRRLLVGDERALARRAQARRVTPEAVMRRRFQREFRVPAGGDQRFFVFGHVTGADGKPVAIGLPVDRLVGERGTHVLDEGPSRSGKTRLALFVARQAMAIPELRTWSFDPKGDLTAGRERILAAEAKKPGGEQLLARLRTIRLFDRTTPPPLRLTAREAGVPIAVQAASVGNALAEASGAELGSRMGHILHYPAELAIELGEPLTRVLDWLTKPATFAAAATASRNERLRHMATHGLQRENRESLRALVARLERVLLLPSVRRALEAPTCFDFREALERFDLILDASNPPAGEEPAVRMLCGPLFGRIARAILNRQVGPQSTPVLCFIDELPEVLGRFEAEGSVGRLTSLAGSRLVNFFLILQDRVQLGPELFHLLRTNCLIETIFRPSHRDAELVAHALPVPEGVERPAQVREALVRRLTQLRRREFLFWCKDGEVPAHFVTAPLVDLDALPAPEVLHALLRARADDERSTAVDEPLCAPADSSALAKPDVHAVPSTSIAAATADYDTFPSLG